MYISKATKNLLETLEKMNQRTISQLSSFFLVIVLAFGISSALTVISKFEKNRVQIFSNLDNRVLFYHCKSKDNDLGLRNLQSGEYWEFSFFTKTCLHQRSSSAIFGTLNSSKIKFHVVFDVFTTVVEFIEDCGEYNCIWIAEDV